MNTNHYKSKNKSVEPLSSGMSVDLRISGLNLISRLLYSRNLSFAFNRLLPIHLSGPDYLSPFDSALKIFSFNLITQVHISSYRLIL